MTSGLFKENMDYVLFLYGLAFVVLAGVSLSIRRTDRHRISFVYLGLFGLTCGIGEWLSLFAAATAGFGLLSSFSLPLTLLSSLMLIESGRRNMNLGIRRGVGLWIFLPLVSVLLLAWTVAGTEGVETVSLYLFGVAGGLWAAMGLFLLSRRSENRCRTWPLAGGILLTLYALSHLVASGAPGLYGSLVDSPTFLRATGVPVEAVRCLLVSGVALSVFLYGQTSFGLDPSVYFYRKKYRLFLFYALAFTIAAAGGQVLTERMGRNEYWHLIRGAGAEMQTLTEAISSRLSLDEKVVHTLSRNPKIVRALTSGEGRAVVEADAALDSCRFDYGFDRCFLLDKDGLVIASSDRKDPDTVAGRQFSFRPYFRQSLEGLMGRQFDFGAGPRDRRYFVSSSVTDNTGEVLGVVAVSMPAYEIEFAFQRHDLAFLVDGGGAIFIASLPGMFFRDLWFRPGVDERKAILSREVAHNELTDFGEREYLVYRNVVDREGWSIVLLTPMARVRAARLLSIMVIMGICVAITGTFAITEWQAESASHILASENRFRAIFEGAPDAIYIYDRERNRIVDANRRMTEWLGFKEEELLRMNGGDVVCPENPAPGDCTYKKKDGSEVAVEETRKELPSGGRGTTLVIARDITERKRLEETLKYLSTVDGLTCLANRRCFDECLAREWKRMKRNNMTLSLIMCDIDFFKSFNDTYGHLAGDDCLREVAGVLKGVASRPGDLAARYGGEEFALVLAETGPKGAVVVAERVRSAVERMGIPHKGSAVCEHVTVSVGVATMALDEGSQSDMLISLADKALYRAKETGRNRVVAAAAVTDPCADRESG